MPTFTNRATLSYNDVVTNSNIVTGELVEVLSATKNAIPDTYAAGDTGTYIISSVNSGATAYTGLTITDDLGSYTVGGTEVAPLDYIEGTARYFQNGVLLPVTVEDPLTITGNTVPAGGNVQVIYEARINNAAPLAVGSTITNVAEIAGGGLTNPITVTETVTVREDASLSIAKSICPDTVVENGQLTYTFVIQNMGNSPAVATDNVTVRDTFDPILSALTVQLDGATLAEGTDYTYDPATGEFATTPGRITVPAAAYVQDPETGIWTISPGVAVLRVTGTV